MPDFAKNLSIIIKLQLLGAMFGLSALCHANSPLTASIEAKSPEPFYVDLTAHLPVNAAATKAVAQTLVQSELYRAYRLAEQQHCKNGWILMGTLLNEKGPDKLQRKITSSVETVWVFSTRRKLTPWTCNVEPAIYLETVRSHLPEWISIRYLADSDINARKTLASLQ